MKATLLRLLVVPRTVAGRGADAWLDGDLATAYALAQTVIAGVLAQEGDVAYRTGNLRFDGQATVAAVARGSHRGHAMSYRGRLS